MCLGNACGIGCSVLTNVEGYQLSRYTCYALLVCVWVYISFHGVQGRGPCYLRLRSL